MWVEGTRQGGRRVPVAPLPLCTGIKLMPMIKFGLHAGLMLQVNATFVVDGDARYRCHVAGAGGTSTCQLGQRQRKERAGLRGKGQQADQLRDSEIS
jgi:hypothetical protein